MFETSCGVKSDIISGALKRSALDIMMHLGLCGGFANRSETKGKKSFLFSIEHVFFDISQKRGGRMRPRRPQTRKRGSSRRASSRHATSPVSAFYEFKRRNVGDRALAL